MRCLLISPPFYRFLNSHGNSVHLGLGYLSAMLRRGGHEVAQVNFDFESKDSYANQKQLFNENRYYKKRVNDPYSAVWVDVGEVLVKFQPDFVGINVFSCSVRQAEIIANECRRLEKRPIVMAGGPMPTIAPLDMVNWTVYDELVGGQAENSINKIVNGQYAKHGVMYCKPPVDLNALPFPDRDNYLNSYEYMNLSPLITQRGCNRNCRGCSHRIMGGKLRWRSTGDVLTEILNIVDDYGVKFFRMFDDFFTANRERVIELCREMPAIGTDITWLAETRLDALDPELLKIMHEAGCVRLKIGIESGSPKMLKWLRKGITVKQIENSCKTIKDIGIGLTVNVMFGMPNEKNKDLQKTIDLCNKIDVDYVTISSYVPYPGSEVFDLVPKDKQKEYPYWTHTSRYPVLNPNLDQGLIDDLLNLNAQKKRV